MENWLCADVLPAGTVWFETFIETISTTKGHLLGLAVGG